MLDSIAGALAQYAQRWGDYPPTTIDDLGSKAPNDVNNGIEALVACLSSDLRGGILFKNEDHLTNVDGDSASAVSDYLIIRESENGLIPVMGGTYKDQFRKTPAGWRFSRKELVHDIKGDMALKNGR